MRVLLDSNVWRYFVDEKAIPDLRRSAIKSGHHVLVAPAIIYEAFRSEDASLRMRLIDALTQPYWKRMMPEAYSEAKELLGEIREKRPEWLRVDQDPILYRRLRFDWRRSRGGFWDRARFEPDLERARVEFADSGTQELAQVQAYELRAQADEIKSGFGRAPLSSLRGRIEGRTDSRIGEHFEPWRYVAMNVWMGALSSERHAYREWLGGVVLLPFLTMQSEDLKKFWLKDIEIGRMPRSWLRFALEYQQRFHKVTDGTPADAQLATYLVDADLFFSADKNFVRMAQRCASEAPFQIAETQLVPGGAAAVQAVLRELER
jgi:hypothetical protein